jgi:hypothetical protein
MRPQPSYRGARLPPPSGLTSLCKRSSVPEVGADNPLHPYTVLHLTRLLILFLIAIHDCLAQPFFAFACDSLPGSTVTPSFRAHSHSFLFSIAFVFLEPARHSQWYMRRGTLLGLLPMFPNESQFNARDFFTSQTSCETRRHLLSFKPQSRQSPSNSVWIHKSSSIVRGRSGIHTSPMRL